MDTNAQTKDSESRRALAGTIDATGWGVFFIWVGVTLVLNVGWGIALLGTGAISLGVQVARMRAGLPVERWSVGFGICLALAGLVQWLDVPLGRAPLPPWVVPASFALLGVAILVSAWRRSHRRE